MHKKQINRLLAAVLSIMMILSLVVVPAGAVDPGAVGYMWDFTNANTTFHAGDTTNDSSHDNGTYGSLTVEAAGETGVVYDTLTLKGKTGGYNHAWCVVAADGSVTVPVTGPCTVAVSTQYGNGGKVTAGDASKDLVAEGTVELSVAQAGDVVITGATYLTKIELKPLAPAVTVDSAQVVTKVGAAASTVTAEVENGTADSWDLAVTGDAVTASVTAGAVTITPAKPGKATVTVKATVNGTEYTKDITVFVAPETQAELADGTIDLRDETVLYTNACIVAEGGYSYNGTQRGATVEQGVTLKLKVPDGKQAQLVATGCCYGGPIEISSSSGTLAKTTVTEGGKDAPVFTITGATGEVTLTATKAGFIHTIAVTLSDAPTGPVDPPTPSTPTSWTFTDPKWETAAGTTVDGLTLGANVAKEATKSHLRTTDGNKGTITVPVTGPCDVKVSYYQANGKVGDAAFFTASNDTNLVETQSYTYTGPGEGTVPVEFKGYITKIELLDSSNGANTVNSLKTDKTSLTVKAAETGTVNAQINGTVTTLYAFSEDTGKATVTVEGTAVKVAGVAEGTVNVALALSATELTSYAQAAAADLKVIVPVTVQPAATGPVYIANGSWTFGNDEAANTLDGLTWGDGVKHDNTHGPYNLSSMKLNLKEASTITVRTCCYGQGCTIDAEGKYTGGLTVTLDGAAVDADKLAVTTEVEEDGQKPRPIIEIKNVGPGELTIGFTGTVYVAALKVAKPDVELVPGGTPGTVDVWDFGAKLVKSDSVQFVNMLGATEAAIVTEINSWFVDPPTPGGADANNKLGDFTTSDGKLKFDGAGRADWRLRVQKPPAGLTYRDNGSVREGSVDPYFSGKVTYNGTVASNGSGAAGAYTLRAIAAGDKITYIHGDDGGSNYGADFVSGAAEAVALSGSGRVNADTVYATQTGDQKLTYNLGKGAMIRIYDEHPTTATISGTVTAAAGFAGDVVFTNADSGIAYTAPVTDGSYTVEVPNYLSGTSYKLSLTGDTKYFISSDRTVTLAKGATTQTANVTVEKIVEANVSGLVGPITATEAAKLKITLTPTDVTKVYVPEVTVTAQTTGDNATWSAQLEAGVEYAVAISNAPDYVLGTPATIQQSTDATVNITLAATPVQAASGKFVTLGPDEMYKPLYPDSTYDPLGATVTALSFKNVADGYVYPATIADGGYTASLRAGAYEAVATVDGYATRGHVVVDNSAVTKDLLFMPTATPAAVDYVAELTVDPAGTGATTFKTVTGALAYVRRMTRPNNERVTIKIAPGTYREQLAIDMPNVTLEPATEGAEVILTWYYGIGYAYYSPSNTSNTNSWYDAENAFDRYKLTDKDVARWGATVRLLSTGFQAEGIIFENSFNRYLTEEEVYDGVRPLKKLGGATGSGITVERNAQLDVKSKAATERGAAIWTDSTNKAGDMAEFKNCKFLSSQDTLGTGARAYFKDCFIEGMTDYICGPGTAVFDGCTLNWKGYSDNAAAGYITAPQTKNNYPDDMGYLFVDCTVSADTDLHVNAGSWARVWGGKNTAVTFLNTELKSTTAGGSDLINSNPWGEMSGAKPTEAPGLKEYGTHLTDGTAVAPKGHAATHMTQAEAEAVKMTDYFNAWTPAWTPEYYEGNTPDQPGELEGAIVILHSNDVHGAIEGYAKMAQLKADYEAKGATVYVMDAGDFSQGTIYVSVSQGATAVELMNLVGYDLAATGNHEFDYGAANLNTLATKADFDILAGNIVKDGQSAYTKSVMLKAGDKKIGVFGLATPETATKAHPAKIQGLSFLAGQDMFDFAQAEVDALTTAGADYIICLGHLGIDAESTGNRSIDLLTKVNGIDVFIDGHSHSTLDKIVEATNAERTVNGAQLTSTGTKFANIGVVTIDKDGKITTACVPTADVTLDETNATVKAVMDKAAEIETAIDADYDAKFATSSVNLNGDKAPGNRTEETNLGDLVTDAMLWRANGFELDVPTENVIALANGGGIRASIAKGNVSKKNVLDVLPFSNTLAVSYVKGSELLETLEAATYCTPTAIGAFPQVSGIQFTVDTTKEFDQGAQYPGSTYYGPASINRVTINSVNGKAFDPEADYAVVTSDFVAAGGDTYYVLSTSEKITDTGEPLEETLMQYITTVLGGTIGSKYAEPQGRISVITAENLDDTLADAIKAAEKLAEETKVSVSGSDVSKDTQWVTQKVMDDYLDAIKAAKAVDPAADADTKIAALNELNAATATFQAAQAAGTKKPTYSAGSGRPVDTAPVTEVKTNDNGDKATTVTQPNGDKTITVVNKDGETVAEIDLPATIPAAKTKFKDVPDDHWAAKSINNMAGLGMVKGVNEQGDVFDMDASMTRGAVATMFFRLSDGKTGLTSTFADVQDHWAADAVAWAAKTGVVNGYSAETFGPDDSITRQQLAVMLCRFANLIGVDSKADAAALSVFTDADKADSWATDSLAWCVKNGVMKGRGDGTLDPTTNITRTEATVMFDRLISLVK